MTAQQLLRSRLAFLSEIATLAILALAQSIFLFEHRPGGIIHGFSDALIWSGSVVVGMQADPVPRGRPGQAVMLVGFATGVVVIASLAGVVGAFLLESRGEPHRNGGEAERPNGGEQE